ncbi:MAG: DUF3137 domain-containing protein [Patescibacteria group bacterium]|nr:MAG: DUF3137 domain-containing protein [Patescibacteria group bacterium]
MTRKEQEQLIARAYEAAHFDERTPEERGFGERFEKEFKPKLIAGIGFNLDVAEARLKRKKKFYALMIAFAILTSPAVIFLQNVEAQRAVEFWIYALVLLGIGGWSYIARKRPNEEDPNHALLLGAVLERFGCAIGSGAALDHAAGKNATIRPDHTSLRILPEYVKGTFDGHVPFTAWRALARKKQGKSSTTIFKGWHLAVDLPFTFVGTTVVYERGARALYRKSGMSDVSLEDPDFSRRFGVLSSDQVEARMILAPDVMHHLSETSQRFKEGQRIRFGSLLLGFSGNSAHVWIPSWETSLSSWRPLEPAVLIESLHDVYEELANLRAFLRDIDVIAESEGFRAQAAKNGAAKAS